MTHHHHAGQPHPSVTVGHSLLRLSALQRLALAGGLMLVLWAAALWAMH